MLSIIIIVKSKDNDDNENDNNKSAKRKQKTAAFAFLVALDVCLNHPVLPDRTFCARVCLKSEFVHLINLVDVGPLVQQLPHHLDAAMESCTLKGDAPKLYQPPAPNPPTHPIITIQLAGAQHDFEKCGILITLARVDWSSSP